MIHSSFVREWTLTSSLSHSHLQASTCQKTSEVEIFLCRNLVNTSTCVVLFRFPVGTITTHRHPPGWHILPIPPRSLSSICTLVSFLDTKRSWQCLRADAPLTAAERCRPGGRSGAQYPVRALIPSEANGFFYTYNAFGPALTWTGTRRCRAER